MQEVKRLVGELQRVLLGTSEVRGCIASIDHIASALGKDRDVEYDRNVFLGYSSLLSDQCAASEKLFEQALDRRVLGELHAIVRSCRSIVSRSLDRLGNSQLIRPFNLGLIEKHLRHDQDALDSLSRRLQAMEARPDIQERIWS